MDFGECDLEFVLFFGVLVFMFNVILCMVLMMGVKVILMYIEILFNYEGYVLCILFVWENYFIGDLIVDMCCMNVFFEDVICLCIIEYYWVYKCFKYCFEGMLGIY